jgi:inner membrane protein involved in colicin E2 resistance
MFYTLLISISEHSSFLKAYLIAALSVLTFDRKPNTRYSITRLGNTAFKKHIEALEKLIK